MSTAYGLHVKAHFYVHCIWSPCIKPFLCPLHMVSTQNPMSLSTAYGLLVNPISMSTAYGLHVKTHFYVQCLWSSPKNPFLCPYHMVSTYKPISLSIAYGLHVKFHFYVHCLWSPRKNPFPCPLHMVNT